VRYADYEMRRVTSPRQRRAEPLLCDLLRPHHPAHVTKAVVAGDLLRKQSSAVRLPATGVQGRLCASATANVTSTDRGLPCSVLQARRDLNTPLAHCAPLLHRRHLYGPQPRVALVTRCEPVPHQTGRTAATQTGESRSFLINLRSSRQVLTLHRHSDVRSPTHVASSTPPTLSCSRPRTPTEYTNRHLPHSDRSLGY
jgi:hypothetical protein